MRSSGDQLLTLLRDKPITIDTIARNTPDFEKLSKENVTSILNYYAQYDYVNRFIPALALNRFHGHFNMLVMEALVSIPTIPRTNFVASA